MARTRSKSGAEAAVSVDTSAVTDTNTTPPASTLMPAATIHEETNPRLAGFSNASSNASSSNHAHISRLASMRTLIQLRTRLDTIDEHSRELRDARRILIKREEALVKERDELVEMLRSVELSIVAGSADFSNQSTRHNFGYAMKGMGDMDDAMDVSEDDLAQEFEPATKRKATKGSATVSSAAVPLAQMPTLIESRPPELQNPSATLPRPLEQPAASQTPQTSPNSKASVRCNGIRFPPGSAPRPRTRSRASSPFTQMLPPPVPASATASPAGTPKPTKVYEPLIGEIDMALFDCGSRSSERALPALPFCPMLTPNTHTPSPNDDYTIPVHLFVDKPPVSWEVTYMGPERTPSPPIGESKITWAPKTKAEDRRRFLEPGPSVPEPKVKIEAQPGTALDGSSKEVFGPASRTRARVSNGGVGAGKGKARA